MNIKLVGDGTVGKALGHNMGITPFGPSDEPIESNVVIICVPTPTNKDGQDLSAVKQALSRIKKTDLVILRSTVLPGTTDSLQKELEFPLMFIPEFGNEDTMVEDLANPDFYVLGVTEKSKDLMGIAIKVLPAGENYVPVRAISAEFCKYFINLWGATQVILANSLFDWIVSQTDSAAIYEETLFAAKNFRNLPQWGWKIFDKNGRGAGGKCLPKDLKAAITQDMGKLADRFFRVIDFNNDEYMRESKKK